MLRAWRGTASRGTADLERADEQAHNGTISVTSKMGVEDHGSKFTVILPIDGSENMSNLPVESAVPRERMVVAPASQGTLEELRFTQQQFGRERVRCALLSLRFCGVAVSVR